MKSRKLFYSALALAVATPALVQTFEVEAATTSFKDIQANYQYKEQIDYLVNQGVIGGYADGTFRPTLGVTRGQFAAFVARALKLEASSARFVDVTPSNALYNEINKAATAGIINGYAGGLFKPNNPVTRADIAVMLDRAMQIKGDFLQTQSLTYTDYNKFKGGYADNSIKRLTFYGVMSAYSSNQFAPTVQGTREATVLSIYNMLKVIETGQPVDGVQPPPPVVTKPFYDMSLAELKQSFGEKYMVLRQDNYKEGIITRDLMKEYYSFYNRGDKSAPSPVAYFEDPNWAGLISSEYNVFYPEYEVISINGVPFTDTNFFNEELYDPYLAMVLPKSPKENGQFYIDLHTNKKEFATYVKGQAIMGGLVEASFVKDGALMVDINLLSKIPGIKINLNNIEYKDTKLNFSLNSNKVQLNGVEKTLTTSIITKNNRTMIPLRSFISAMGFESYQIKWANRIEITNYPLEVIEGLRDR